MANQQPGSVTVLGMPLSDFPFVDEERKLTWIWFNFLRALWQRAGGAVATLVSGAIDPVNHTADLTIGPTSIQLLGVSAPIGGAAEIVTPVAGQPGVPQVLGASPFVFTAGFQGLLLVESGQVAFQRPGMAAPVVCGLQGGLLRLLVNDTVTITWYKTAPQVVFLPGGA